MITITKKEDIVFNQVKIFINDYPYSIIINIDKIQTNE